MKTALVTGASSGIGKETAKKLAAEGYTVFGAARRVEKMQDLKALGVIPVEMDITKEEDVLRVVQQITESRGGVDVLVNNAGFGLYGAMEDTPLSEARRQFEVNLFGLARLTQLVLPGMRRRSAGKIVNITSIGGKIFTPLGSWYHATKHALEGWSDCLRLETAAFGIDVIIIEPGLITTEFGDVLLDQMLDRSGSGAYAETTRSLASALGASSGRPLASSPPSVIAEVIARALKARRPKTRYAAGAMAKPLLFLRRFFSDRLFDRVVMNMIK